MQVIANTDFGDFARQLRELGKSARKRVGRKAVTQGGQEYVKVAKSKCPIRDTKAALKSAGIKVGVGRKKVARKEGGASYVEYKDKCGRLVKVSYRGGLLKKAQGYKVKTYGGTAVAICGTRDGFRQRIGTRVSGKNQGEPIYANPTKYAHLIIKGTRSSPPRDFDTPAAHSAGATTYLTAKDEMEKCIQEAAQS